MIKELLISILLIQSSCGQIASADHSYTSSYIYTWEQRCVMEGGILVDRWQKICISSFFRPQIQENPVTQDTNGIMKNFKTDMWISLSKVEVIEIADYTISLNMDVRINWFDFRLGLNSEMKEQIYLSEEEQKQIWSPQIFIARNMKSIKTKSKQLGFSKDFAFWNERIEGMKKYYLSAAIKCDMDFQNFPFDEHICHLEVS